MKSADKLNYDHPDSFDTELLVQHLQALRRGESVKVPVYDYTIHNRSDKTITVHPAPVIIVEGILIFASQELCDMMDMKVFCGYRCRCAHSAPHCTRC